MDITVIKNDPYFIVRHHDKILTRSELEPGYNYLADLVKDHGYKYAICDLSHIDTFAVNS